MLPLIEQALCLHVPNLAEAICGRLALVDGTDILTGNRAGHKDNYSGKRHRAGLNIQVASDTEGGLLEMIKGGSYCCLGCLPSSATLPGYLGL